MCIFAASLAAQTPSFTAAAVLNAASFAAGPIAPREDLEIFGTGLGPATLVTCGAVFPIPTSCGHIRTGER